jgi:hypothetical protein
MLAVTHVSAVIETSVSVFVAMVWEAVRRTRDEGTVASSVESIDPSTISLFPAELGARSAAVSDALNTSAPVTASAPIVGFGCVPARSPPAGPVVFPGRRGASAEIPFSP